MGPSVYLQRYAYPKSWIKAPPAPDLGLVVTIPCYNENTVIPTLSGLVKCHLPECMVEVLVVVNQAKDSTHAIKEINEKCLSEAKIWSRKNSTDRIQFHIIFADELPNRDHGVGLARKIGMDEALRRLDTAGNVDKGVIAGLDADCACSQDYLVEIYDHFKANPNCPGVSIYFEHPMAELDDIEWRKGIIQYELHLRYYIHAQRFSGFPYAFHTIGSCMAVRADAYQKQGGMNKRKAGEDFYFLHKIISLGGYNELTSTTVVPSGRISNRVPFGTGKAMKDWKVTGSSQKQRQTYNPEAFLAVKQLFTSVTNFYQEKQIPSLPPVLEIFLKKESFSQALLEMRRKTADPHTFHKRFYTWFNAFKLMKYVHFCRDNGYPNIPVTEAAKWLLSRAYKYDTSPDDPESLLKILRSIDKKGN